MSRVTCYNADGEILKTLFQWDVNQTIEVSGLDVESAPNFHFCNRFSKEALVVVSAPSDVGYAVKIPNILLQQAETITAYIYQADQAGGFRTASVIYIPVTCRPRPDDYVYNNNIDYISLTQCSARLSALERLLAQDEPDTSQLSLLIETYMLPAVHDADGKILTDENGKIILRY